MQTMQMSRYVQEQGHEGNSPASANSTSRSRLACQVNIPKIYKRWGHVVGQLVEVLRYKPESCGFDFSLTKSFRPHYRPRFDLPSDRNEYPDYFLECKGGRCVEVTTLPTSCADCRGIWEPQPPGTLRACPGLYRDCFTFTFFQDPW